MYKLSSSKGVAFPRSRIVTEISASGEITFSFFRPNVLEVFVAGTFNNWMLGAAPMVWQGDGWWKLTMRLMPGEHQFRYVADGEWYTDHAANGLERSRGNWNSLVVVPPAREERVAA
jgi:1,4-alpha-glucan branching enzyme